MSSSSAIFLDADQLIGKLQRLCAQPSTSGHLHKLHRTARLVGDMLRKIGFDVRVVQTAGAPVVVGWRAGRRPFSLLLYHHYDVTPTGPWNNWFHDPFQVSERDSNVYGRGVAHGKGPFVAQVQALQALLNVEGELPHGVLFVVEGEGLTGSPSIANVIRRYSGKMHIGACLGSSGEHDPSGRPFCYSGSKGLLQVKLRAQGTTFPLPPGLATSVRNPLWRLTWALAEIKGSDEDIRINGFYDNVEGPGRDERAILRQVQLDEHGRLAAWNMSEFLFGMTGSALVRTEVTLPTCNLSSFTTEPPNAMFSIPTAATARLDFHLVPYQRPDEVMDMLRKHLVDRGFEDIEIERLPGGYAPIHQAISLPFVQHLSRAGEQVYGTPLSVLPFGTFTHPFAIFFHHLKTPVASLGFGRHTSSEYGPNEHLPIEDLVHHGQMLIELMVTGHESAREVAFVQPQPGPVVESQ